jgi:NitT/TauT family transport system substrate-binding protein/putative hydroxymethylpyrimidine transport system substrate-binding protein
MPLPRAALALIVICVLTAAGCGDDANDDTAAKTRPTIELALDFTPNAAHAPIFAAVDSGADRKHGIRLSVRDPGDTPDSLKLVAGGRAQVGILDIHDLAVARAKGVDVVAIGALVQRPLAALLAHPSIRRPRDLEGKTVGVSGLPSDPAFLRAIVEADGGDYETIRQITIGFKAVPALIARRVDAVPAFWNAEGVALDQRGVEVRQFRVEDFGAPVYPEVVLIAMRETVEQRPKELKAVLETLADGIDDVRARPDDVVKLVAERANTNDTGLIEAQLEATAPLFEPPVRLDRAILERWADFDDRIGIVDERPDVDRAFALGLAAP